MRVDLRRRVLGPVCRPAGCEVTARAALFHRGAIHVRLRPRRPAPPAPRPPIAVRSLRDSLTVLAILLIGVLTAALVAPYLIDWDAHRALVERRMSEAAGAPVTVAGPIELRILPKPRLALGGVRIGGPAAGQPHLAVAEVEAEVSFAALLRGEIQVTDTTLVRPRLAIAQAADGRFDLGLPGGAARIAVDHLGVREGTLALAWNDGRTSTLAGIDLDGEATTLRGPFKAAGRVGTVAFRLATGALESGRMRLKLHVDAAAPRPAIDLDGTVASGQGGGGPRFEGGATLAGAQQLEGTPATIPWTLTGRVTADRDAAAASDVELRAGTDMRALIASGEGRAAFGAGADRPAVTLDLHGAALDLDRLAVAPEEGSVAPPRGPDLLAMLVRDAGSGGGPWPLRLDLATRFDTATLAGQTLIGPSARLGLGAEREAAVAVSVSGPQGTRLALDGRLDPGPDRPVSGPFGAAPALADPVFRGRADLRSGNLGRTAAWLSRLAPSVAATLATLPGRTVSAGGAVEASRTGVVARDVSLAVDGSRFTGSLSLTRAVGAEPARLFADLACDALVLDRLPDLTSVSTAARDLDLDLALTARAVTVADPGIDPGTGRPAPVTAGNLALKLTRRSGALSLDTLALDVDGASVTASGARGAEEARAEVAISAPHVAPLARTLAPLLPAALAAGLRERAALLSPLDATLRIVAQGGSGAPAPTRFSLVGTAGGTHVEVGLAPLPAGQGRAGDVSATLRAEAPEGGDLLRQLGASVAVAGLGPARVEAQGRGSLADGLAVTAEGRVAGATLGFAGRGSTAGGGGRLTLAAPDLRPVLAGLGGGAASGPVPADAAGDLAWDPAGLAWHGLEAHVAGVAVAGDLALALVPQAPAADAVPAPRLSGRLSLDRLAAGELATLAVGSAAPPAAGAAWSVAPFGPPLALPDAALAIQIDTMPLLAGLAARQVRLDWRSHAGAVSLGALAGRIGEGSVGGGLTLRRDPTGATLSGQITWRDVALAAGDFTGRASGRQELAAAGASPAALLASLSGAGTLDLTSLALARTDPAAPAAVVAAVTARDVAAERASGSTDPTPADPEVLRRDLGARLDRGPLPIGDARLPVTLAGGVLRLGPVRSAAASPPPWSAETSAAVDFGTLTLSSRTVLRSSAGDAGAGAGEVVVTRAGPLAGPIRREVDVSGLIAALQAQAIARAQERIDVMEQDIRERAAFNRQLKAIQADQERARQRAAAEVQARADQLKAEAQARAERAKAEADRAKAEELRIRAEVAAAAKAAAERQREAPVPSIVEEKGERAPAITVPPAAGP